MRITRKLAPTPVCTCCDRIARDIPSVITAAAFAGVTPETFIIEQDNSYDYATGEFICDGCFAVQASVYGSELAYHS